MSEWLCESCKHRNGKLRLMSTYDMYGTKYSYTGSMKVHCKASKRNPNMYRDAVREGIGSCYDYAKRKGKA